MNYKKKKKFNIKISESFYRSIVSVSTMISFSLSFVDTTVVIPGPLSPPPLPSLSISPLLLLLLPLHLPLLEVGGDRAVGGVLDERVDVRSTLRLHRVGPPTDEQRLSLLAEVYRENKHL